MTAEHKEQPIPAPIIKIRQAPPWDQSKVISEGRLIQLITDLEAQPGELYCFWSPNEVSFADLLFDINTWLINVERKPYHLRPSCSDD